MWDGLLLLLTLALFILPFLPALQELRYKHDVTPGKIIQTHTGNIHYFAQSFRVFIERELEALGVHATTAEPPETYHLIEDNGLQLDQEESHNRTIQRVLIALQTLELPNDCIFTREIYGRQAILGSYNNRFRAVLAEGDLCLGSQSVVLRWAHARTVRVAPDCRIMGRLSAEEMILLGPGCTFTRVHAPCVRFGSPLSLALAEPADRTRRSPKRKIALRPGVSRTDDSGRLLVDGDWELPEDGIWNGHVIVHGDVWIRPGAQFLGSLKAQGSLHIEQQATITGSLVSTTYLCIAKACTIGGPVVADQHIDLHAGTVIGTAQKPTTVVAPIVHVANGAVVYGTVWARTEGATFLLL